jgi:hypothetical protein
MLKSETTFHQTSSIKQYRQIKCSAIFDVKVCIHATDAQHEINLQNKLLTPSRDDILEYGWDNNFYKLIDVRKLLTTFTLSERSCVQAFLLSLSNLLN